MCHMPSKLPKDVDYFLSAYSVHFQSFTFAVTFRPLIRVYILHDPTAASMSCALLNISARRGLLFPFGILVQLLVRSGTSTILADMLLISRITCRLVPENTRSASADIRGMQNMSTAIWLDFVSTAHSSSSLKVLGGGEACSVSR